MELIFLHFLHEHMSSLCLNDEETSMTHLAVEALRPFEGVTRDVSAV